MPNFYFHEQQKEELMDALLDCMSATNKIECNAMKSFTLADLNESMEQTRVALKKAAKLLSEVKALPESVNDSLSWYETHRIQTVTG